MLRGGGEAASRGGGGGPGAGAGGGCSLRRGGAGRGLHPELCPRSLAAPGRRRAAGSLGIFISLPISHRGDVCGFCLSK